MQRKTNAYLKAVAVVGVALFVLMMISIGLRFFTRQILIEGLGINNTFTKLIFFDAGGLGSAGKETSPNTTVSIDWAALYPFDEAEGNTDTHIIESTGTDVCSEKQGLISQYQKMAEGVRDQIEAYATEHLAGYDRFVRLANQYKKVSRWDYSSYNEYNGVVSLQGGYLTSYIPEQDATECAESIQGLKEQCEKIGANFLYVQAPHKICREDIVSGVSDFSNQNADSLLAELDLLGVDSFDLRDEIHADGLSHHELFYRTDHHWTTETAVWAARKIAAQLSHQYGVSGDLALLDESKFEKRIYPQSLLGGHGRKVTLARTEPDDFTLLFPDYEARFHYYNPEKGIDRDGDYSVMLDMSQLEKVNYTNSPYSAYNYGDVPLAEIENLNSCGTEKILLIHDSFFDPVTCFLALAYRNIESIDLRHFTGSLVSYIQKEKPDIIMVMYYPDGIGPIDWESHKSQFDFR